MGNIPPTRNNIETTTTTITSSVSNELTEQITNQIREYGQEQFDVASEVASINLKREKSIVPNQRIYHKNGIRRKRNNIIFSSPSPNHDWFPEDFCVEVDTTGLATDLNKGLESDAILAALTRLTKLELKGSPSNVCCSFGRQNNCRETNKAAATCLVRMFKHYLNLRTKAIENGNSAQERPRWKRLTLLASKQNDPLLKGIISVESTSKLFQGLSITFEEDESKYDEGEDLEDISPLMDTLVSSFMDHGMSDLKLELCQFRDKATTTKLKELLVSASLQELTLSDVRFADKSLLKLLEQGLKQQSEKTNGDYLKRFCLNASQWPMKDLTSVLSSLKDHTQLEILEVNYDFENNEDEKDDNSFINFVSKTFLSDEHQLKTLRLKQGLTIDIEVLSDVLKTNNTTLLEVDISIEPKVNKYDGLFSLLVDPTNSLLKVSITGLHVNKFASYLKRRKERDDTYCHRRKLRCLVIDTNLESLVCTGTAIGYRENNIEKRLASANGILSLVKKQFPYLYDFGSKTNKCFYPNNELRQEDGDLGTVARNIAISMERNQVGRALLHPSVVKTVPLGLWPLVLSKACLRRSILRKTSDDMKKSVCECLPFDGIYYMVHDLLVKGPLRNRVAAASVASTTSGKKKRRDVKQSSEDRKPPAKKKQRSSKNKDDTASPNIAKNAQKNNLDDEKMRNTKVAAGVSPPTITSTELSDETPSSISGVSRRRSSRRQRNVHISAPSTTPTTVKSDQKKNETDKQALNDEQTFLIGSMVRRRFMVGSKAKWFKGEVTRYNEDTRFYLVVYDDGDSEECKIEELRTILVASSAKKTTMRAAVIVQPKSNGDPISNNGETAGGGEKGLSPALGQRTPSVEEEIDSDATSVMSSDEGE